MKINLTNWENKHQAIRINGEKLSFIDEGDSQEVILVIHGFGSSSVDYHKVIDKLEDKYRVIIPDLIGFGLSSKPKNYYYTILEHAQVLVDFLSKLNIKKIAVISHGFGTSILSEILAIVKDYPSVLTIKNIHLLNGSLTIEQCTDASSRKIVENNITTNFIKIITSFEMFKKYFKVSFFNNKCNSEEQLELFWKLQNLNGGNEIIKFIDYCIVERKQMSRKSIQTLKQFSGQINIIWGDGDHLGSLKFGKRLHEIFSGSNLKIIKNCGHFPMLEKSEEFIDAILEAELAYI
jgi:pimeloyl-ACP methyl ester carboxylesterase